MIDSMDFKQKKAFDLKIIHNMLRSKDNCSPKKPQVETSSTSFERYIIVFRLKSAWLKARSRFFSLILLGHLFMHIKKIYDSFFLKYIAKKYVLKSFITN